MKAPEFTVQLHYCEAMEGWFVADCDLDKYIAGRWLKQNGIQYLFWEHRDTVQHVMLFDETDAHLFYMRFA